MKNVNWVIDQNINIIETKLAEKKRHVISTETLKLMSKRHLNISTDTDDAKYCVKVGFNHLVCQRLYARGYRSLRDGYFVNLDTCYDIDYLKKLLENSDATLQEKASVNQRIREIRNTRCDCQYEFDENMNIVETLTEEQFIEKIKEDAV